MVKRRQRNGISANPWIPDHIFHAMNALWAGAGFGKRSKEVGNKQGIRDATKVLWVGGLPVGITNSELKMHGGCTAVWAKVYSGKGKRTGVISYKSAADVVHAAHALNGSALKGALIEADVYEKRNKTACTSKQVFGTSYGKRGEGPAGGKGGEGRKRKKRKMGDYAQSIETDSEVMQNVIQTVIQKYYDGLGDCACCHEAHSHADGGDCHETHGAGHDCSRDHGNGGHADHGYGHDSEGHGHGDGGDCHENHGAGHDCSRDHGSARGGCGHGRGHN